MKAEQPTGPLRVVFAGGGTGGHLYPAIAMADELKRRTVDAHIVFVGTKKRIEARVVPSLGYRFRSIWISGFRRSLNLETILFPVKLLVSLVQSFFLLREERAGVVVGTGGYVSGPVVYMATLMGVPTLIQEQNSFPGVTTRLLASRVSEVHISLSESSKYLRNATNVNLTGNPTRALVGSVSPEEGRRFYGLDEKKTTLLVFGGSQGAKSINATLSENLVDLVNGGIQVLWQTGEEDFAGANGLVEKLGLSTQIRVMKFIERMEYAYGAGTLAICRSGATTIAELAMAGLPSILIPYPHAAADHQTHNARAMTESGGAILLREDELKTRFQEEVLRLLGDSQLLSTMARRARDTAKPRATQDLVDAIIRLAARPSDRRDA